MLPADEHTAKVRKKPCVTQVTREICPTTMREADFQKKDGKVIKSGKNSPEHRRKVNFGGIEHKVTMSKIQYFAEITPNLPFSEFNF